MAITQDVINGWQEFLTARNWGENKWTMGTLASRMIAGLDDNEPGCERSNANMRRSDLAALAQTVASIPVESCVNPKSRHPQLVNTENTEALDQLIRAILKDYTPDFELAISYLHSQLIKLASTRPRPSQNTRSHFVYDHELSETAHHDFVDSEGAIFDFLEDVLMVNDPLYRAFGNEMCIYLRSHPVFWGNSWIMMHRLGNFNDYKPELKLHIRYSGLYKGILLREVYDGLLNIRSGQFEWKLPVVKTFVDDVCPDICPREWNDIIQTAVHFGYEKTGLTPVPTV